jgi:hypothetical protein
VELEGTSIAHDQHYTVSELAKRWHLSPNTVRRLVADEPGVIKITVGALLRNRRKRHLVSLRIPERVALRVHARLTS